MHSLNRDIDTTSSTQRNIINLKHTRMKHYSYADGLTRIAIGSFSSVPPSLSKLGNQCKLRPK